MKWRVGVDRVNQKVHVEKYHLRNVSFRLSSSSSIASANSPRLVPAKLLRLSHPKGFLREFRGALSRFAAKADSRGFVQRFFEGDRALLHRLPDQPLDVRIQSDRGPHARIVASVFLLS